MAIDRGLQLVLSPEARVVLLTAGGSEVDEDLRAALRGPLDWSRVAWLSDWEHASSVVWRRLAAVGGDLIPREIGASWEPLAMVAEFRAATLRDQFVRTLQEFAGAGIPVILLKGAGLAHCIYENYLDRPMGDVDLLVPPERANEAWALAQRIGWTWDEASYPLSRYEGHHHLPPLLDSRKTGTKLELHTALAVFGHPFSFGYDSLMAASREVTPAGVPARMLAESHQVVHLCVHFAWSHMMTLGARRTFRDLRALIDGGHVDWDKVIALASRHGATSSCYWTLELASRLVGVAVPEHVIRALRVPLVPGCRGAITRHLTTQLFATERVCPSETLRRALWTAAMRPTRFRLGEGRPWDVDGLPGDPASEPVALSRRALRHLERAVEWAHYLRMVAVPR